MARGGGPGTTIAMKKLEAWRGGLHDYEEFPQAISELGKPMGFNDEMLGQNLGMERWFYKDMGEFFVGFGQRDICVDIIGLKLGMENVLSFFPNQFLCVFLEVMIFILFNFFGEAKT